MVNTFLVAYGTLQKKIGGLFANSSRAFVRNPSSRTSRKAIRDREASFLKTTAHTQASLASSKLLRANPFPAWQFASDFYVAN